MIDEVADEILKNRIDPIRSAHDGLVQQNDVFTKFTEKNSRWKGKGKRNKPRRILKLKNCYSIYNRFVTDEKSSAERFF